jgi:hypothetical protein
MEIEFTKPTPEQEALQKLFQNNQERIIKCLIDETKELYDKLHAWEKCADSLVKFVREYLSIINYYENDVEYNKAEEAIEAYKELKNELQLE